jgi:FMN phosphatase YigB (HAD superfamily)
MQAFKNLIFDLGDVIIHIDYQVTMQEFQKLAVVDFTEIITSANQQRLFDLFEKGAITAAQFRDAIRKFLKPGTTDEEIDRAWNSILIDYPEAKFALLKNLKQHYRTYALSNTNEIHLASLNKAAQTLFGERDLAGFFHNAYYSNLMGHRKPDKEIYELIITKENLVPAETFFIDDREENVEAAKKFGLQAYQLKNRGNLFALLTELEIIKDK